MSTESKKSPEAFVPTPPTPAATPTAQPVSQPKGSSIFAILGLVFAFLIPFVGFILSIIGMSQTKNNKQSGRGLAIAGIIVSSILMFLGLIWIVILIVAGVTASNDTASTYLDSTYSTVDTAKTTVSGAVGDVVSVDDFDLTVTKVTRNYVAPESYYTPSAGKEYILVNVELENFSKESEQFSSYDFKVRNTAGEENYSTFITSLPDQLDSASLASGGKTTGNMMFEVDKGSTPTLVYTPGYFAKQVAEIRL